MSTIFTNFLLIFQKKITILVKIASLYYYFFMEILKQLMKQNKESSYDIAKLLGITHTAAYNYMSGKHEPNIEKLKKLADHYNVTVDFLIGHPTKSSLPLNLFSEKQQELLAVIKNLNDEECLKTLGYIDGLQGKDFKSVDWEN